MPLLRIAQNLATRSVGRAMRLPRRELAMLRRWLEASAAARLQYAATPDAAEVLRLPPSERREGDRRALLMTAEVRPISAGGIGLVHPAEVRDVSRDGIALCTAEPVRRGQQLAIQIHPPAALPRRRFARPDSAVNLLAVVRYCRSEGARHVLGCSIGIDWADSLANQMFPPDLPVRRSA